MEMLRDNIKGLEHKIVEMIRNGQDNVAIADRLHRWTRALMLTADPRDLPEVLVRELKHAVPGAAARRCGCGAWPIAYAALRFAQGASDDVRSFAASLHAAVLRRQLRLRGRAAGWKSPSSVASLAMVPLRHAGAPARPSACWCSARPTPRATAPTWAPSSWRASARSASAGLRGCCRRNDREPAARRRRCPTQIAALPAAPARSSAAWRRARWRCTATRCTRLHGRRARRRRRPATRCSRTTCGAGSRGCTRSGLAPRSMALVLSAWRGLYRWWGQRGEVAHNPVEGVRAPKAPEAAAEGACRSTRRWRWPSRRRRGDRRRCARCARATTPSSSCCTAAACASASWSALDAGPGAPGARLDRSRRRQRACARQGQQAAQRAGGRAAARALRAWLALRDATGHAATRRRCSSAGAARACRPARCARA